MPIPDSVKSVLITAHVRGLVALRRPKGYKRGFHPEAVKCYHLAKSGNEKNQTPAVREISELLGLPIPLNGYELTDKDTEALTLLRDAYASHYKRSLAAETWEALIVEAEAIKNPIL